MSGPGGVRLLPMGERAFLIELDALDDVVAAHASLSASRPAGVVDLVPAARTILVRLDGTLPLSAARRWATEASGVRTGADAQPPRTVVIDVVYDGEDLADVAAHLGMSVPALVRRHTDAEWVVAFTGFAPGFGYLVSEDWPFDVPRLAAPRARVPAGSVAVAAGFSGAYPRASPGGWRILGSTDAVLFDPDAETPVLLAPGTRVRFADATGPRPRRDSPAATEPARRASPAPNAAAGRDGIRIEDPGALATIQDLGRPGRAAAGVSSSGALDRTALRLANRLVGNDEGAAAVEVTIGGFRAVAGTTMWFAVTGAWGDITLDGAPRDPAQPHRWRAGEELRIAPFAHGVRGYLAVRGGIDAPEAMGSRATDLLAGIGPAPLAAGDVLPVGAAAVVPVPVADALPWRIPDDDEIELDAAPGPRADWFAPSAVRALFDTVWTVSPAADRVGVRLDGPSLERVRDDELPSEGMVPGALQVPPEGRPVILGADGPVTGGYPVIAVLTDAAQDLLAQARPGTRVRLRHARPTV